MNYFLGIRQSDNVLAADFEDTATGLQPPGHGHDGDSRQRRVAPRGRDVRRHDLAAVRGRRPRRAAPSSAPSRRAPTAFSTPPSAPRSARGGAVPSGQTQGFFNGVMDEVRIWSGARTLQQIQDGMSGEIMAAPGLLGRWGFNEGAGGAGTAVADSSGNGNNGVLSGAFTWVPGVPFTTVNHAPDAPILNAPADDATGVASPVTLDVSVSDSDADPLTVTYFGRPQGRRRSRLHGRDDSRHAALRRRSGARGDLHGPDELDRRQPRAD